MRTLALLLCLTAGSLFAQCPNGVCNLPVQGRPQVQNIQGGCSNCQQAAPRAFRVVRQRPVRGFFARLFGR